MRLGRTLTAKTAALNVEIRKMAQATGAVLLDLAAYEIAEDPRVWAVDRIHGNPEGHARIADALAHLLELPGAKADGLTRPLPSLERRRRDVLVEDLAWAAKFVAPWAWRRLRGRTTGDGITAKRPVLTRMRR
jgi:hypothetical protein